MCTVLRGGSVVAGAVLAAALLLGGGELPLWAAEQEQRSGGSQEDLQRQVRELREQIERLQRQLERLQAATGEGGATSLREIERRIEALARDLERLRLGAAAEVRAEESKYGFGPAASKVYRTRRGLSVGGYGEMLFQGFDSRRDDGTPSGKSDTLDFVRGVFYFGYKFNDRIVFNSEIEYEHATTGEGADEKGEVSVEFAYVDFLIHESFNVRTGLLLAPLGFINELHEPPIFHGARRPEVETQIIPTTWRDNGAGVFGDFGPWSYRAYVMAPLDGTGFSGTNLRGARQSGSKSNVEDLAFAARLDLSGVPGLLAGASVYTGESGLDNFRGGRLTLADVHAEWKWRGLELRGLVARGIISDVESINANHAGGPLSGSGTVGERLFGWYAQAAYDVLAPVEATEQQLFAFARYGRLDTQHRVPPGFDRDGTTDRTVFTGGLTYKPIDNIAIKVDYQNFNNDAGTGTNQFNLAVGYLF